MPGKIKELPPPESVRVEQTYGLSRIDKILKDPRNHVLPIDQCKPYKFIQEDDEYRANSVILPKRTPKGAITANVKVEGTFFPGFVFYDSTGMEVIQICVNGEEKGVAVAGFNDNNQHLFYLIEPVNFIGSGNTLELWVSHPRPEEGDLECRTEVLVLMAERPKPRKPIFAIGNVGLHEDEKGRWTVTWTTTQRANCSIIFGLQHQPVVAPKAFNNHRFELRQIQPGYRRQFRIAALSIASGESLVSDLYDFPPKTALAQPLCKPRTGKVKLHVRTHKSSGPAEWPVSGGVPFPRGHLYSPHRVRLIREEKSVGATELPLQVKVTGRWSDGSIKWLLVDFRHSGGSGDYILQYGPKIVRKKPYEIPFAPLAAPFGHVELKDGVGREFKADLVLDGKDCEEEGPLRRCTRVAGSFANVGLAYELRVHEYAGMPWVRVLFTFEIDGASEFALLRSLAVKLPLPCVGRHHVRQHTDDRYDSSVGSGKRWSAALGPLWVRDFWQNYPKDLELEEGAATLWLLPQLEADEYESWLTDHSAKEDEKEWLRRRLFFWVNPEPLPGALHLTYKLRRGMTKTHEVWIGLDGSPPQSERPLFAACDPNWYADSKAFGPIHRSNVTHPLVTHPLATRPLVETYDAQVTSVFRAYRKRQNEYREYGMFNFGDWWGERQNNWGNLEYDTAHGLFLQFIRSGEEQFFRVAEEAAVHGRDIDTVHDPTDPSRDGQVYSHCVGHVGDYYSEEAIGDAGSAAAACRITHTWAQGYFDHYFLTGDRRSLETALKIADYHASYGTMNYDFTNCRVPGWHLTLCMGAYRATNNPFYLNACRIIVDRVLERQTMEPALGTAGGGWRRRLKPGPGHCTEECQPRHHGNVAYMIGILLTGLRWYHMEAGDSSVAKSIYLAARFLIDDVWEESQRTFRNSTCPRSGTSRKNAFQNFLMFDGMAYALQHFPDCGEISAVLADGAGAATLALSNILTLDPEDPKGWHRNLGKYFSMSICVTPHCIGTLADLAARAP